MSTDLSRQHRRHTFRASCIARSATDGRLLGDRTLDVSYSGMRIALIDQARVGERVELSFEVPATKLWIRASGRVERIERGLRDGDEGAALGVRIDRMHGFDRLLLATIARGLPEARGERGQRRDYARVVARIDGEHRS